MVVVVMAVVATSACCGHKGQQQDDGGCAHGRAGRGGGGWARAAAAGRGRGEAALIFSVLAGCRAVLLAGRAAKAGLGAPGLFVPPEGGRRAGRPAAGDAVDPKQPLLQPQRHPPAWLGGGSSGGPSGGALGCWRAGAGLGGGRGQGQTGSRRWRQPLMSADGRPRALRPACSTCCRPHSDLPATTPPPWQALAETTDCWYACYMAAPADKEPPPQPLRQRARSGRVMSRKVSEMRSPTAPARLGMLCIHCDIGQQDA